MLRQEQFEYYGPNILFYNKSVTASYYAAASEVGRENRKQRNMYKGSYKKIKKFLNI